MAQYPAIVPEPMGLEPPVEPRRVMTVAEVETQRRSRLLRYLIFGLGGFIAILLIFLAVNPQVRNGTGLIALSFTLILCIIAYLLNRSVTPRRVMIAAYLALGGFTATMMLSFSFLPGGMGAETLRLFDILLIPTVAAGVVIDATASFIFASVVSLYVCTVILILPPSPTLLSLDRLPFASIWAQQPGHNVLLCSPTYSHQRVWAPLV
jgi:putative flippase GtrA